MEGASAAAIEVLVQNLINVFKEDRSLIRGVEEDAQKLQRTLGMIQSYLNDAENKSTQNTVKFWLGELEAVAFDADNVLDELSYHHLRNKVNKMKSPKDKVLSCFSSFDHGARPRNMALRIKQINEDFDSLNKRATELGLQSIFVNAPSATSLHASFETDSFTLDPIFIGRDDDLPMLVEKLTGTLPEERIFSILAIVGMGGMGKTTLTRKVFHHEAMKARFRSRIWIHVSQTFDPIMLFKKILSTLTPNWTDGGVENRESILKKLQEALKSKTYLLVLDDVWNEDTLKWDDFMNSMSGVTSTKGNGIIITTRTERVASIVRPLLSLPLKGLSDEDCWSIIKEKSFQNVEVPSAFEMIGRKIAKRCQGLPLAANVVGGVLWGKSEQEWSFINEKWLSDGEGGENISKILKLSFDHLTSPSIKKCFAYCSIFPKGHKITKQELIEQWMAEGFLQPDQRNEMEIVGNKFIKVLLHNSLLQVAQKDECGNVWRCVMHDLVHDMACSILGSYNINANAITTVRYMSLKDNASPIPKQVAKHVRTLFLKGGETSGKMLSNLESIHVLTLENYEGKKLPGSIRKLIHLRNLDVSHTRIRNLPEWIGELHRLQTLRANSEYISTLPSTLKYLIDLRHLYIPRRVKLPGEIGRLTCLQTLSHFTVGKEKGYRIEELGSLKNLKGKLVIHNLDKVADKEEALKAKIFQKPNLIDVEFAGFANREGESHNESVLEGLQPHQNIKKLGIKEFHGKRFPLWTEKMAVRDGPQGSWLPLNNLIELRLSWCSECEEIPTLEHLPNLIYLYLEGLKKVRCINSSFSNLISLYVVFLDGLESLPDWLFHRNKSLSKLMIMECPKLRELPDGVDTLNSLEELSIRNCDNLTSTGSPGGHESQGSLRKLWIEGCRGLMEVSCQMLESWAPSLETLQLVSLPSLRNLPVLINCLTKSPTCLTRLRILGVPKFMATNGSVESWDLGKLRLLGIDVSVEWSRVTSVAIKDTAEAILQQCSHSLTILVLKGMEDWDQVPASIQHLTALSCLTLENIGMEELPQWLGNLASLYDLSLHSCKKLMRLPSRDVLERLTKLHRLFIKNCPGLHIDSVWRNKLDLTIYVDQRRIESNSK